MSFINSGPLSPVGPDQAPLLIVSEFPSDAEVYSKTPYSDNANQALDSLLTNAGLTRGDCRLDYLVLRAPVGNSVGHLHGSEELKQGLKRINEFIATHKSTLKAIIFLGELCLNYLQDKRGIDVWRGSVILYDGIPSVQTYSLRHLLRSPNDYPFVAFDFAKAVGFLEKPYKPIKYSFILDPSPTEAFEIAAEYGSQEYLANDIETNMGASHIICNGYAKSATEAVVLVNHGAPDLDPQFYSLSDQLNRSSAKKIYQNAPFDIGFWNRVGSEVENLEWDTLLGIHVLQPEFPRGLDFLTSIYTDQPYYKHMTKMGDSKSWNSRVAKKTLYEYNGIDCCVTYQVAMKQIEEFKEHDPSLLALFRYEMDMIPVSLHLTESGMLYDMETRDRLNQVVISKFNFAQETLNNIFKRTVNVKSPLLKDLLYGELGLPVRKDPKTGAVTTGEDAIVSLIGYTETKIRESVKEETKMKYKMQQFALRLILLIRGYRTLKSNYIDVELHDDMRCRSSWNIGATETGRWSASKAVDDTGLNAQTFPREVIEYDDEELKVITASVS